MTDNSRRTGAAIEAHYRFVVWLVATIEKFPKSHKFTIGDRIEITALNVLDVSGAVPTSTPPRTTRPSQSGVVHGEPSVGSAS
jgi:hypothetical protein